MLANESCCRIYCGRTADGLRTRAAPVRQSRSTVTRAGAPATTAPQPSRFRSRVTAPGRPRRGVVAAAARAAGADPPGGRTVKMRGRGRWDPRRRPARFSARAEGGLGIGPVCDARVGAGPGVGAQEPQRRARRLAPGRLGVPAHRDRPVFARPARPTRWRPLICHVADLTPGRRTRRYCCWST